MDKIIIAADAATDTAADTAAFRALWDPKEPPDQPGRWEQRLHPFKQKTDFASGSGLFCPC